MNLSSKPAICYSGFIGSPSQLEWRYPHPVAAPAPASLIPLLRGPGAFKPPRAGPPAYVECGRFRHVPERLPLLPWGVLFPLLRQWAVAHATSRQIARYRAAEVVREHALSELRRDRGVDLLGILILPESSSARCGDVPRPSTFTGSSAVRQMISSRAIQDLSFSPPPSPPPPCRLWQRPSPFVSRGREDQSGVSPPRLLHFVA